MIASPAWLDGVLAGVVTPFGDDGTLDETSFRSHLEQLAESGLSSIVVCAETGEGPHLHQDERTRILRFAVDAVGDRIPVLTGLIASFTAEAAERAREAEGAGAVGLQLFAPPSFLGRPLDPALAGGYVEGIAAATELPLIVYTPPLELGYGIDDAAVARMLEIDGVVALKESSFDRATYRRSQQLVREAGRKLLSGADTFIPESLEIGCDGMALALAAVAPHAYARMFEIWRTEGTEAGVAAALALEPIAQTVFAPPFRDFRVRLKEGLRQLGVIASADVRSPLLPLSPHETDAIADMLTRSGVGATS
jgi:4-hydroxy-tetrahydrodipicolinate synthase